MFSYKLRRVLTVGPGGPTLPADPGKPVGPWKQKNYSKVYNRKQYELYENSISSDKPACSHKILSAPYDLWVMKWSYRCTLCSSSTFQSSNTNWPLQIQNFIRKAFIRGVDYFVGIYTLKLPNWTKQRYWDNQRVQLTGGPWAPAKPWGPGDPASPFWPGSPTSPLTPGWPSGPW